MIRKGPTEIRLEGVSKTFHDPTRGTVEAVKRVDVTVNPGELVTLLGPSGCGKTTLLRMVAGLEMPSTGRIIIGNVDQTEVAANRRDIGFVFQNYALFPHMTVYDNIAYGLKLRRMGSREVKEAVREVIQLVGLEGLERRFQNQLSGGEQQRVALARVIVTRPSVLLFDEPLSNLDAKRRVQMREEIRSLQKSLGITSLYVTHDQEEALAISDRIVVMSRGHVEQIGSPQEIYARPRTVFVAGFVGKTNVLPGAVSDVAGGVAHVTSLGRTFRVPTSETAFRAGQAVNLLIRPEAVTLHTSRSAVNGTVGGTVKLVTYLGEKAEYIVEVAGTEIQATAYDTQGENLLAPGMDVLVELPEGRMAVVEGE